MPITWQTNTRSQKKKNQTQKHEYQNIKLKGPVIGRPTDRRCPDRPLHHTSPRRKKVDNLELGNGPPDGPLDLEWTIILSDMTKQNSWKIIWQATDRQTSDGASPRSSGSAQCRSILDSSDGSVEKFYPLDGS